jgi:hypothetical protein
MDLSAALSATEGEVLTAFRACVGAPGASQRELADLSLKFGDLRAVLDRAPNDARRLEIMKDAARIFNEIAARGPRP